MRCPVSPPDPSRINPHSLASRGGCLFVVRYVIALLFFSNFGLVGLDSVREVELSSGLDIEC